MDLNTLYILLCLFGAATLALVLLDTALRGNALLNSFREWQTLIGAVVGFAAVSLSIVLQGEMTARKELVHRIQGELALAQNASVEIESALATINAWNATLPRKDKINHQSCITAIEIVRSQNIRRLSFDNRLTVLSSQLSAYTYATMLEASDVYRVLDNALAPELRHQCMLDSMQTIQFLNDTLSKTRQALMATKKKLQVLIINLHELVRQP